MDLLAEERDGRPLFTSPLQEPVLLRYVRGWVKNALEDRRALDEIQNKNSASTKQG